MHIKSVSLRNFRNILKQDVTLCKGINILCGSNAQGKTNFLEAIYFCSTGRSQRSHSDKELINFSSNDSHLHISIINEQNCDKIDVHLKKDSRKGMAVNGIAVNKLSELFGVLLCVIFSPEDLQLIKAGPSQRRKFIDMELCQLSKVYYYSLQQYYKALNQRNALIKSIRRDKEHKKSLFAWDEQLVYYGVKIIDYRAEFTENLNKIAKEIHGSITNGKEALQMLYKPNIQADSFAEKLAKNVERDVLMGSTTTGIHKDDIVFYIGGKDAKIYSSQGQQRTACLAAKLAEIEIIKYNKLNTPVLLLDDVLSELDFQRQSYLIHKIKNLQTILTCTGAGIDDIFKKLQKDSNKIYEVENGQFKSKN